MSKKAILTAKMKQQHKIKAEALMQTEKEEVKLKEDEIMPGNYIKLSQVVSE
jgi:hypothetical protein